MLFPRRGGNMLKNTKDIIFYVFFPIIPMGSIRYSCPIRLVSTYISVEFSGSCSSSLIDRTIRTLLSGWQVLIKTFPSLASDKCKSKMLYATSWADISVALINLLPKCYNFLLTETLPWLIFVIASRCSCDTPRLDLFM